jgi:hypothetical protein
MSQADGIRSFLIQRYIAPARARGDSSVSIRSGDVHREMNLQNAMPAVCQVLDGRRFHSEAGVRLVARDGPAASSTVAITYEIVGKAESAPKVPPGAQTLSANSSVLARIPAEASNPVDWFWEGNVVSAIARHLEVQGWTILSTADTATKARGADIHAQKGKDVLLVEVKGYPSTSYRDPKRASERKPTSPAVQAQHWYSHALLKALRLQHQTPVACVAIGLPDFPRYRALLDETEAALGKLGVSVVLVGSTGQVDWSVMRRNE